MKWEEPKSPIEITKFIVSHTYYFLLKFYEVKKLDKFAYSNIFADYLNNFKRTFPKFKIDDKFSFDLMNKFYEDKSSIKNDSEINNDS